MKFAGLLVALLALGACSSEAPKKEAAEQKKEPPKQMEPLTGRQAFQQMYIAARQWAPDCQPLQLSSIQLSNVKVKPGQAGAWQCVFVSQSRSRAKSFTWSAIESEGNLHQGVFAGQEESYTPSHQSQPFTISAIKTDSDEAVEIASKKHAAAVKKLQDTPVNFHLEQTPRFPDVAWRIFWGESISTAAFSVFVDASTGEVLGR